MSPRQAVAASLARTHQLEPPAPIEQAPDNIAAVPPSTTGGSQQRAAANERWAKVRKHEADLEEYFNSIPVDQALEELSLMRTDCDRAAKVINQRISPDDANATCHTCGGGRQSNKGWSMVRGVKDPKTQIYSNEYFCSMICVARDNQKKQGLGSISDRGGKLPDPEPETATKSAAATSTPKKTSTSGKSSSKKGQGQKGRDKQ
jgi:hypothetical protein